MKYRAAEGRVRPATRARPRGRRAAAIVAGDGDPYWTRLPVELARGAGRAAGQWLDDVLWSQFCVFLFIRLQDDVFDEQAQDRRLVYLADLFLFEAERTLGRHFARSSPFWRVFHECLDRSTRAILRVDALQRRPAGRPADLLAAYARVADVFKIGIAAACLKLRRTRILPALFGFADEMAMAGQIVDDLEDVGEDLQRGRYNFAAKSLLGGKRIPALDAADAIAREILHADGARRVLAVARRRFRRAERAARALPLPVAAAQASAGRADLDRWSRALHRKTVALVLGERRLAATAIGSEGGGAGPSAAFWRA